MATYDDTDIDLGGDQIEAPAYAPAYTPARTGGALGAYQPRTPRGVAYQQAIRDREAENNKTVAPDPNAKVFFVGPPTAEAHQGSLKDFGDQMAAGAMQIGHDLLGAASATARALNSDPDTVAWIERQKAAVGQHVEDTIAGMSPEAQQAMNASVFNSGDDPAKPTWGQAGYLRTIGATVASLIPQVALAVLPGGIVGRAAAKVATTVGAGAKGAATAATVGSLGTTAAAFGATDAGAAYNHIVEEVDKATEREMMNSPVYNHLREVGYDDTTARKMLVAQIAPSFVSAHFAAGAAAGAAGGSILRSGALGAASKGMLTRAAVGAGEGAAAMGGQAGVDTRLDQAAEIQTGRRQDYDNSALAQAVASGVLAGGALGAVGGAMHRRVVPKTPKIDPGIQAALDEALARQPKADESGQFEMPFRQPPPVSDPYVPPDVGAQGEMFRPPGSADALPPGAPPPATPPSAPPGVPPGALQQSLAMREPPPVVEPHIPPGTEAQGEMFRPSGEPPAEQTTVQPVAQNGITPAIPTPAAPTVVPPAPTVAPPPTVGGTPAPRSRANLIKALIEAGEMPATVNAMKTPALQRRYDALHPTAEPGLATTDAVNVPPAPVQTEATKPVARDQTSASPGPTSPLIEPASAPVGSAESTAPTVELKPLEPKAPEPPAPKPPEPPAATTPVLTPDQKLRAQAQIKRLEQKAKLAPPAARAPGARAPSSTVIDQEGARVGTVDEAGKLERTDTTANTPAVVKLDPTKLIEVAKRAARMESLPPGVVEQWARDVAKVVQGADSPEAAHQALVDWGKQDAPVTGSKIRRGPVADKMMELLTGERSARAEALAREAREEVQAKPTLYESEGVAKKADLEDKSAREQDATRQETIDQGAAATHEEETGGLTTQSFGEGEKTRSETSTDKTRVLQDIEHKIINEGMTIAEAEEAYGTKTGRGRDRKYPTVQNWLEERAKAEEDPVTRGHIQEALDKHADPVGFEARQQALRDSGRKPAIDKGHALVAEGEALIPALEQLDKDNGWHGGTKKDGTPRDGGMVGRLKRDLNKVLALIEEHAAGGEAFLERTFGKIGPWRTETIDLNHETVKATSETKAALEAWIKKAHDYLDVLDQSFEKNRAPQSPRSSSEPLFQRATEDGLSPSQSRYVRVAKDPRLNDFVGKLIDQAEADGVQITQHDLLRAIIRHTGVKEEMRPLHELAKRLLANSPDLPIASPDHALMQGHITGEEYSKFNARTLGMTVFDRDKLTWPEVANGQRAYLRPRAVVLDAKRPSVEAVLHEASHSVTASYIDKLLKYDPHHKDIQFLDALLIELGEPTAGGQKLVHAMTNLHELHTWMMTSPDMQAMAAERVASDKFRARLAEIGIPVREKGRSVWRYFTDWVYRALGMKAPASASEYTLLDHILRPLQDLSDRAVRHNEKMLPKDPMLRATAEPLYRTMTGTMGAAGDRMRAAIPDRDTPDRAAEKIRPAKLAATPFDQIVTGYRDAFQPSDRLKIGSNPLDRARDTTNDIAHVKHEFATEFGDRGARLVSRAEALAPETRRQLGQLMNETTIAKAELGATHADANSHLTTPEALADLAALQARYKTMPAEAQSLYQDVRRINIDMDKRELEAKLSGVLSSAFPDADAGQRAAFSKAARSKEGFAKFLADPDNSEIARAFGPDGWRSQRALSVAVAKALDVGRVQGDYFRLGRFGDYVVRYGERGTPEYGSERFETRGDADARYAELAAQGVDHLDQVDLLDKSALREVARGHPLANEIEAALRNRPDLAKHADAVRNIMDRIMLEASARTDASHIRRRGVTGASVDFGRVLSKDIVDSAERVGYLQHGGERYRALADMKLVVEDLARHGKDGDAIKARQVLTEIQKKITVQENPGGVVASLSRTASTVGYVQSMMSFSHIFLNSIDLYAHGMPRLGARHGLGNATVAMAKAMKDVAPTMLHQGLKGTQAAFHRSLQNSDWNLAHFARDQFIKNGANSDHMTKLFAAQERAGLIDHTKNRELRRIAKLGSGTLFKKTGSYFERFTDIMGMMTHAVDAMNKSAIAKAAFDLEFRKTKDVDKSVAHAMDILRKTSPNYNLHNAERISTSAGPLGAAAAPMMQFKRYGFWAYSIMGGLIKESTRNADKAARWEAQKTLAGIIATHTLMAGTFTWLADPLRYIGGLYDLLFTDRTKPHNRQAAIRGWMSDMWGPQIAQLVAHGVGPTVGAAFHNRVGMANPLGVPELESFDTKGLAKMLGNAVFGASGDNAMTFTGGLFKLAHADLSGFQDVVPRPIRDAGKAVKLATTGLTDTTGKVIMPADRLSGWDVALQAAGIQPSRVSEFREGRYNVQETQREARELRTQLEEAWIKAAPIDRAAIMTKIREYNQDNPFSRLTVDQMVRTMASRRKQAAQPPGAFGLKLPAKGQAALTQAGRFANMQ